ncbi:MAG: hypothetical protein EOO59_09615, partial [Hymenobacter sp.]
MGRVLGDIVLAKGAGAAGNMALEGATALNRVAAVRYLASDASLAKNFGEVKGFNIGLGSAASRCRNRWGGPKRVGSCPTNSSLPAPEPPSKRPST